MPAAETEERASRHSLVSNLSRSTTVDSLHGFDLSQGSSTSPLQESQNSARDPTYAEGPLQNLNFELPSTFSGIGSLAPPCNRQEHRASHDFLDSDGQHRVLNCSYCLENSSSQTSVYHEIKENQQAEMERQQSPEGDKICGLPLAQILRSRRNKSKGRPNSAARGLRRHKSALYIITVYSIVTVVTWTLTCVLSYKPISFATYYDETGRFSDEQYKENDRWRKFAKVMPSLLGAISIPVTSAICAKAAAVYSLRHSRTSVPGVTMEQRLASADKYLLDNGTLKDLRRSGTDRSISSPLLISSALLCGLAIVIWGLQAGFVDTVLTTVFTSADATASPSGAAIPVGSTLFDINSVSNNEIIEKTISGSVTDRQDNLWPMDSSQPSPTDLEALYNQSDDSSVPRFFITSIPVGTDTGILRAIALRLNSSLSCENVLYTDLPSNCEEDPSESSIPLANHTVRTCVSSEEFELLVGQDRLDISEDYWFDFQVNDGTKASSKASANGSSAQADQGPNSFHHCQQNTTLAYFEPPNYWNNHTVRDIINISATDTHYQTGPNTRLQTQILNSNMSTPSPLLTSILAMFGNDNFQTFSNATTIVSSPLTCSQLYPPFTSLLPYFATILNISTAIPPPSHCEDATLSTYLLQAFSNPETLAAALRITSFYTSQAMLDPSSSASTTTDSSYQNSTPNSAEIFASPGLEIQKMHVPLPAMVLISVLMLIQLAGLWGLAVYASYYCIEMGGVDGE